MMTTQKLEEENAALKRARKIFFDGLSDNAIEQLKTLLALHHGDYPELNAMFTVLSSSTFTGGNGRIADVVEKVLIMQKEHAETWANDSNWIWLINLQEEIDELRMTMLGEHEGPIEHELCQIASIAINWLRKPELLQTPYSDIALLTGESDGQTNVTV